jgi:hypothetical protein
MPERGLEVGRLVLRAPWLDEGQAHALAHAVATGLAAGTPGGDVPARLSLAVSAAEDDDVDTLAERIVRALTRDLGLGR